MADLSTESATTTVEKIDTAQLLANIESAISKLDDKVNGLCTVMEKMDVTVSNMNDRIDKIDKMVTELPNININGLNTCITCGDKRINTNCEECVDLYCPNCYTGKTCHCCGCAICDSCGSKSSFYRNPRCSHCMGD